MIKREGVYHGSAIYDFEEHRWRFPETKERRKGVYIFMDEAGEDILKVGKADGKGGIAGRLNQYQKNSRGFLKNPSSSASCIKRVQETGLRHPKIGIYYIPLDPIPLTVAGLDILASPARELEQAIFILAREAGHSLLFCKQKK